MTEFDQIYRDIDNLPEEAKTLLSEFIDLLKKHYLKSAHNSEKKSNYERFDEVGLIGCCSVEENLSTDYKKVLADTLETKYDHR